MFTLAPCVLLEPGNDRMRLTGRSGSSWDGRGRTSEAMIVASSDTDKVAVARLQTANVVANGVLVLDHVTSYHSTEVFVVTPLHCKRTHDHMFTQNRLEPVLLIL